MPDTKILNSPWRCLQVAAALGIATVSASPSLVAAEAPSVAVMGDSLATGAGTDPALIFDADALWSIVKGERPAAPGPIDPTLMPPPVRLWKSQREFHGSLDWVAGHILGGLASLYLDTEESSWGYLAARALGVEASRIYIVAEHGARMDSFPRQADRILNHLNGKLPAHILVLFTGQDLCAAHMREITSAEHFGDALEAGLHYLVRNGEAHPQGSAIHVMGFLGVTQVLTRESILGKKVFAHGEEVSCKDLRARGFRPAKAISQPRHEESLYFQQFVPPNPASLCPTLFAQTILARSELGFFTSLDPREREARVKNLTQEMTSQLAGQVRLYRQKSQAIVKRAEHWARTAFPEKSIRISYLPDTEYVTFEGDDIASDCFHLSLAGQKKVAEAIVKGLKVGSKLQPSH